MSKYKIAIITAFIGNGGTTGEITFTPEAQAQLDAYGVDVYRFNNDNVDLLHPHLVPLIKKESIIVENVWDKLLNVYNQIKYKQKIVPTAEDNHTRLIAKIPKILFYKLIPQDYDYYIWLDSKFTIHKHWLDYVLWLIEHNSSAEIITSKHSERSTIESEYKFMADFIKKSDCSICSKYQMTDITRQLHQYNKNKWFVDDLLFELTMIIYSKSLLETKIDFLEEWYAHNYFLSIQDQLSFPLLVKKHKIKVAQIIQRVFDMPFVSHEYSRNTHL